MHFAKSPDETGCEHHRDEGIVLPQLAAVRMVNGYVPGQLGRLGLSALWALIERLLNRKLDA
jgi:hypothetical protein